VTHLGPGRYPRRIAIKGCSLPNSRPYIIHSNLVNFNVKYLKNRRIGYPTCIPFLKISPRWVYLNNKNDMLRIMQEKTRQETKPTIFCYFFMNFCNRMFTFPTHLSPWTLKEKNIFRLNDTSFYALSTKSNDYLKYAFFFISSQELKQNRYISTLSEYLKTPVISRIGFYWENAKFEVKCR